jgi:hypothetical protein
VCHHDHQLVPGEAGDGVGVAHGLLQALGHLAQQEIARVVPQRIVHLFEVVEIDEENLRRA